MTAPGATSDGPTPRVSGTSPDGSGATVSADGTSRTDGPSRTASASALWRDVAGGAAADPGFAWALGLGVVLIALGLLGFVPNPLVGAPSAVWGTPLLLTGDAHDVIHLVGGAIALHAALGMSRPHRDGVLIGLGAAALILLALGLLDGRWFGVAPYPVGLADQLLHLIVGLGCLVMGLAGSGTIEVPLVTGAYRRAAARSAASTTGVVSEPVASESAEVEPAEALPAEALPAEAMPAEAMPAEAMPEPLGLEIDDTPAEPAADPDADPDVEPAAEPPAEPAADPDTAPAAEPAAEPPAEPAADPEPAAATDAEDPGPTRQSVER